MSMPASAPCCLGPTETGSAPSHSGPRTDRSTPASARCPLVTCSAAASCQRRRPGREKLTPPVSGPPKRRGTRRWVTPDYSALARATAHPGLWKRTLAAVVGKLVRQEFQSHKTSKARCTYDQVLQCHSVQELHSHWYL